MLKDASFLKGLVIHAMDGELGSVGEFLFDDSSWAIRYLVVDTGGWLGGKRVLISPVAILEADWGAKRLDVTLTMQQVRDSPDINTHQPVSRQYEADYLDHYGYPYYWSGPYSWGESEFPFGMPAVPPPSPDEIRERARKPQSADSHLRSSNDVEGYRVETIDGDIGHIHGFVVDDQSWSIRYLVISTRNWLPGKKVLVSPAWAETTSWEASSIYIAATKEAIKSAPEYVDSRPLTREDEDQIYAHYGQAPYWVRDSQTAAPMF